MTRYLTCQHTQLVVVVVLARLSLSRYGGLRIKAKCHAGHARPCCFKGDRLPRDTGRAGPGLERSFFLGGRSLGGARLSIFAGVTSNYFSLDV
ncbi:hypothetical protein F4804DRAFT_310682 [Jackrogersella minutella]|nr:hypothetical protein F4804DRAFT_310682 [Jackrogersella minutella]